MSRLRVVLSIDIVSVLLVAEVLDVNSVILIIANIDASKISEVTPPTEEVLEPLAGERRLLLGDTQLLIFRIVFARFVFM